MRVPGMSPIRPLARLSSSDLFASVYLTADTKTCMRLPLAAVWASATTSTCSALLALRPSSVTDLCRRPLPRLLRMASSTTTDPKTLSGDVADYAILAGEAVTFSGAWSFPGEPMRVMLRRNTRDVEKDKQRSFLLNYLVTDEPRWVEGCAFPVELSGVSAMTASPSGQYMLLFKDDAKPEAAKEGESKPVVEVWSRSSLIRTLVLDQAHGKVMGDAWFGGFSWSADESVLAYVAEVKRPKAESAFKPDQPPGPPSTTPSPSSDKFEFREDWGEKYDGVSQLGLFVLSLSTGRVARVAAVADHLTPGQPVLSPDASHVVYTAWSNLPRRLGIIFCQQRPAALYAADVSATVKALMEMDPQAKSDNPAPPSPPAAVCLTPSDRVARSPVLSRDGSRLAYLANQDGFDTHNGPVALRVLDWKAFIQGQAAGGAPRLQSRTLVDTVASPPSPSAFPGLWLDNLPRECWAMDDASLFLTTMWRSRAVVLRVDAQTGTLEVMEPKGTSGAARLLPGEASDKDCSVSLLSVTAKGLLLAASSPRSPGGFGLLSSSGGGSFLPGPALDKAAVSAALYQPARYASVRSRLSEVRWEVLDLQPKDLGQPFQAILILPPTTTPAEGAKAGGLPPLVVVPHGGPHSVMPTSFLHSYAFLAVSHGLALLHVNFRGSTGFGADALASLPGRIGTQDVSDVLQATQAVVAREPAVVDGSRVGIVGGSHGGFLSAHMIGQHPEVFKAAALRNPVTNIPGMVTSTDIPDWCFVEALGSGAYDFRAACQVATPQQLSDMLQASPIAHVHKVRAPTLIALGAKDRRVPYSQGVEYYHALRAVGVPTKLLVYPEDVHAIDKPASEADHWIHIGQWLAQHL